MAGPNEISVRQPAAAGTFYPADAGQCRAAAQTLVRVGPPPADVQRGLGGIVPHAGWVCSGAIAGEVLGTLARVARPDLVVVFGAVHSPIDLPLAAMDSHERWAVPGGTSENARELAEALEKSSDLFATDDRLHNREHAVEVELPLIRAVWPEARVLPIELPLIDGAADVGRRVARAVLDRGAVPVFLASSDLTHYGPSYRFAPAGVGEAGLAWARENDRKLLQRVTEFEIERIVPEVRQHLNACGGGAIAAMLAACQEAGASSARVLTHASSYQTLAPIAPQQPINAVGYAGVIVS